MSALHFECRPSLGDPDFDFDLKVVVESPDSTKTTPIMHEFTGKINTKSGFFRVFVANSHGDTQNRRICVRDGSLSRALDVVEHSAWRVGLRGVQTVTGQYDDSGYRIPGDLQIYKQCGYQMSYWSTLLTWWNPDCPVLVWKDRPVDPLGPIGFPKSR